MISKMEEVTDELLESVEQGLWSIMDKIAPPQPSDERIKLIKEAIELAKLQKIAEESVGFAIDGVSQGFKGVLDTLISLGKGETPNRRY